MMIMTEYLDRDAEMAYIEADYKLQQIAADCLGITLDEYLDFVADMEVNTVEFDLDELEQMYAEYCRDYGIPCEQIPDYACYDKMGW